MQEWIVIGKRDVIYEPEFWRKLSWTKVTEDNHLQNGKTWEKKQGGLPGSHTKISNQRGPLLGNIWKQCVEGQEKKKKKGTPSKQIKYADYMKGNPAELLLIYFFFWVIETQKQDNLRYETQRKKWWANRIPLLSTPVICKNKQNDATPRQVPSSFNDGHLFVFFRKTSI